MSLGLGPYTVGATYNDMDLRGSPVVSSPPPTYGVSGQTFSHQPHIGNKIFLNLQITPARCGQDPEVFIAFR